MCNNLTISPCTTAISILSFRNLLNWPAVNTAYVCIFKTTGFKWNHYLTSIAHLPPPTCSTPSTEEQVNLHRSDLLQYWTNRTRGNTAEHPMYFCVKGSKAATSMPGRHSSDLVAVTATALQPQSYREMLKLGRCSKSTQTPDLSGWVRATRGPGHASDEESRDLSSQQVQPSPQCQHMSKQLMPPGHCCRTPRETEWMR